MSAASRRTPARGLQTVLAVTLLGAVAWHALGRGEWRQLRGIEPDWPLLALTLVLHVVYVLCYGLLWQRITRDYGVALPVRRGLAVWTMSNFGKYLPLRMTGLGYRMFAYARAGAGGASGGSRVALACYTESLASVLAGAVIALTVVFEPRLSAALPGPTLPLTALACLAIAMLLAPPLQRRALALALRLLRRPGAATALSMRDTGTLVLLYLACWTFLGLLLNLVLESLIAGWTWQHAVFVTQAYAIAGLAGTISVFAPAGLGVREGVLVVALGSLMSPAMAALAAAVARLMTTLAEWSLIGWGFWVEERHRRNAPAGEQEHASD